MKTAKTTGRTEVRQRAAAVAAALEMRITAGTARHGTLLPSVRMISRDTGCAPLTALRALRDLERRGLVAAERGRGYRVARGNQPQPRRELVAFLEEPEEGTTALGGIYRTQMATLQQESIRRGCSVMVLPFHGQPAAQIVEELARMAATAVILQEVDTPLPVELSERLRELPVPIINLSGPYGLSGMDYVLRDEAHGASLAAEYLIGRGHRKIGWYGPLRGQYTSRHRYAGAAEVLLREGLDVGAQGWADVTDAGDVAAARQYLLRKERPPAVLALTSTAALALARAALDLGLNLGEELDIVGWCMEENYRLHYEATCPELTETCPTVIWRMADVARSVFARIEDRRRDPELPVASVLLPMALRKPAVGARNPKQRDMRNR